MNVPAVVVIGVGNPLRGDDEAGRAVARLVREQALPGVAVVEQEGEPTALMDAWQHARAAILVDALRGGLKAGDIRRLDASRLPLPAPAFGSSTHAFGLFEAVELARSLNQLPPVLIVYGIQGSSFDAGAGLSPDVEAAVPRAAVRIAAEARTLTET